MVSTHMGSVSAPVCKRSADVHAADAPVRLGCILAAMSCISWKGPCQTALSLKLRPPRRFLAALEQAGARPVRAPAYLTGIGFAPTDCLVERDMLEHGAVSAIAFSSQAEVRLFLLAAQPAGDVALVLHGG